MKELSDITALFVDHQGLYLPLAKRLLSSYKRIIYHDPCEEAFPTVNRAVIGDSFPPDDRFEVSTDDDWWFKKSDIDLAILPDSRGAGLAYELLSQGIPVWGSQGSSTLEHSRGQFLEILKQLGFEIPKWKKVIGLDALRDYLKDKEDKFIKISKFRGTMETRKWRSYEDDEGWLDYMAVKLGLVKNLQAFYVFEKIDTDLELGGDTYRVGRWPRLVLDGYEWKDKGYFGHLKPYEELPEQTRAVLEAFGPILDDAGHANFWSMEIRVKDDHSYFLDPTPRGPIPGTGAQTIVYKNLPEIIAAGAEGEMVDPEPAAPYVAEVALSCKGPPGESWTTVRIPKELEPWVKLSTCCQVDGRYGFPPLSQSDGDEIGWMGAIGNTPEELINTMLEQVALLPDGVDAATDALISLLQEIHSAEEQGIEFSRKHEIPEPETVVTNGE